MRSLPQQILIWGLQKTLDSPIKSGNDEALDSRPFDRLMALSNVERLRGNDEWPCHDYCFLKR
ncbi:hypothetical protein ACFL1N_08645 [Thermodesulfobacteriota bacterium]